MTGAVPARAHAVARLLAGTWRCETCGLDHGWPFDLVSVAPDGWPYRDGYEDNAAVVVALDAAEQGERIDFLSEDFCLLDGRNYLVRCVLLLPVDGLAEPLGFGCWTSLSEANFRRYLDGFDSGRHRDRGPWTGWLCTRLEGLVGEQPIAVRLHVGDARQRPLIEVIDPDEPLAAAQRDGIAPDRLVELLDFYGHA
jgi:hypothetical protein